mgnify:CR=1 FL=1
MSKNRECNLSDREDLAIQVKGISKTYLIWDEPVARLWSALKSAARSLLSSKGETEFKHQTSKHCREFAALDDINLHVKRGENVGIIGLNGSGKSTLLQIIAGILQPSAGNVEVKGRLAALLELGSGFNPEFTGRENVYLNGTVLGLSRGEIENRFDQIAQFADIGVFIDDPVKTYSSGMFVRLAFAVATHVSADILLIDEALTVGDIFFQQRCYARLNDLRDRGVAIVLVTHGMNDVEQFCDRAYLIHQGKVQASGPSAEVVKHYYLLNKGKPAVPSFTNRDNKEDDDQADESEADSPPETADLDLSEATQVSDGTAKFTRISVCDSTGQPNRRFPQGHKMVLYYEFTLNEPIDVPIVGVVLFNNRGIIVHGKSSTEYGSEFPSGFGPGQILKFRHEIQLELAVGEYTMEVGCASMSVADRARASQLTHQELNEFMHRHCHVPNLGPIEVSYRTHSKPVQLLHHGIANLPGQIEWRGNSTSK